MPEQSPSVPDQFVYLKYESTLISIPTYDDHMIDQVRNYWLNQIVTLSSFLVHQGRLRLYIVHILFNYIVLNDD